MLYFMLSSVHGPGAGSLSELLILNGSLNLTTGLLAGTAIILIIEMNAIWGKLFSFIASVRGVISSGLVLTVLLSSVSYYL